jgi:hypothetical protein
VLLIRLRFFQFHRLDLAYCDSTRQTLRAHISSLLIVNLPFLLSFLYNESRRLTLSILPFTFARPKSSSTTHAFSSALSTYLDFLTDDLQATHSLFAPSSSLSGHPKKPVVGPAELQHRWRAIKDVVQALAELAGIVSSGLSRSFPLSLNC